MEKIYCILNNFANGTTNGILNELLAVPALNVP